jgi:putative hydrolase of the HAD superfamily
MKRKIKAILFDIDDTLFDRNLAQIKVLELIVKKIPSAFRKISMEKITEAFLESDRLTVADFNSGAPSTNLRDNRSKLFLRLLGIAENYANIITETYVRDYPTVYAPVPGAVLIVEKLSKKCQIGVVSNAMPDVQYKKLETLKLRNMLSCIVLSEEIGIRKPELGIFLHAAQLLGRQPDECLFVGDSYTNDIVGAKKAGMRTCWFNPAKSSLPDNEIRTDYVVTDLSEIPALLK